MVLRRLINALQPALEDNAQGDLRSAALRVLYPQFHGHNDASGSSGRSNPRTIKEDRDRIARTRAWLATQEDRRVRGAYEYWLAYFERGCAEAERAMAKQKVIDRMAQDLPKPPAR